MGLYSDHVLPRIIDKTCGMKSLRPLRERVCRGLSGRVLEVGFGSGSSVPFYPAAVTGVSAVEPSDTAWRMAGGRLAAAKIPVDRSGLDGESLPFEDASFDSALSTWTLCTIPDVGAALAEIRRVLKPGGTLHFVEHGLAPDASVQKWQFRLDGLQQRLFGGCHLTRQVDSLITGAGFTLTELDSWYEPKAPRFAAAFSLGVATA